jgi:poly-gamma-glutamate capsule biosynthesis protein CapA/YwtB (metallophosphatase superfamily)/outer membrane protein assembly factor BamB
MSLGWRFSSPGHLTDGAIAHRAGQPVSIVASHARQVHALTSAGQVLWREGTAGPVYVLAVLDGDRVAVGDDAGRVTLIGANGRRLWRHDLGSRVTTLHGGWQGGLLAGGWDERLTLLNTELAGDRVRWQADLDSPASGIATLPSLALAATLDGQVRAYDPTGAEVWRFDAGAPVTGLGAVEGLQEAMVLAGVQDGRLLALDAGGRGTRLRWQQTLGQGAPVWDIADLVGDAVPEIVAGTGGAEPLLGVLSAAGGWLWRVTTPSPVGAIATLDLDGDGTLEILAGLASGEVQAFDRQGRLRGSIHAGLPVWGLEAADDGTALVLADVVAWQIAGVSGPAGGSWMPPPAMVASLPGSLPAQQGTGDEAVLVFLGDIAPGRSMERQLIRYGPAYPWEGLGPLLHGADLAAANLECVLTTQGQPLDKDYLIRAHPRWGQSLVEAGIDLVTLANNHALDFGQVGLDETLSTLESLEIAAVGAGSSEDAAQAHNPALFTLNGIRVAVLGYAAERWNGSEDVPVTQRLAWAEPDAVQADVRAVRDRADVVVVLLHAGTEYATEPSPDQVAVAHAAVDAGADLVVGHHPHVTQTVEQYRQGLIVYSLGDALFDIPYPAAMQGDLLRVHVTREGLAQAELWPFWIDGAIRPRLLDDGQGAPRVKIIYP